jgi:predicted RND superfamily exporter protein
MRLTIRQRWLNLLGRIADWPRTAASVAFALLLFSAGVIDAPDIEGSMVDQLSGSNEQLEIARRISAATGNRTTVAVIVTPGDLSIGDAFSSLAELRDTFARLGDDVSIHSIDAARDQLFLYGLGEGDSLRELLLALRDTPQSVSIMNKPSSMSPRFLVVIDVPEVLAAAALASVEAHPWQNTFDEHAFLASAQLERDVAAGLERDLRVLLPAIIAATLVALFFAFAYWRALLLPLFASVASTVITFALFSVSVVTINLVTLLALPVVLIVGLANSCHFLANSESASVSESEVDAAVRHTMLRVGPPFFFSTLTTSIALASLGFNELPPIANLGLLSASALLLVFVLVLLAAPLSLRWYLRGSRHSLQRSKLFADISGWLSGRRKQISVVLLVAMIGGAAAVPLMSVKSDPRAFFPDGAPFSSTLQLFEEEFYFFSPLRVLVSVDTHEPLDALRQAGQLRDGLAESVRGVVAVSMQAAANSDNTYVITVLLRSQERLAAALIAVDFLSAGDGVTAAYSNASLVYESIDRQATESLLRSLGWSVALIFGAILIVFRSLRALLGAMLANAVPLLLVCGVVWLVGNPLNLVTVFVFLVALGVVVDDSIHILFWRASGDALSGSSIEFSVLLSTAILCLGLLLWQLSAFPTTRQFAAYCALALLAAVISNLSVLPYFLRKKRSDVQVSNG